ncbi:hypothetical protein ACIQYL_25485 [Lysinibacillus xylanilyticus]|uniref:hypothetical protein n=1 Tax=Lysinibacillus xylanilyticus TaxID=582475 RepID=UPI00380BFF21
MSDIALSIYDGHLTKFEKTSMDGYIDSYILALDFSKKNETIGEIAITFDVIGYGAEGFDGGIDISFQVMYFQDPVNTEDYLDDDEAFIYIFSNHGRDIMDIVNLAYNALDDFYTKGTPLSEFAKHFK